MNNSIGSNIFNALCILVLALFAFGCSSFNIDAGVTKQQRDTADSPFFSGPGDFTIPDFTTPANQQKTKPEVYIDPKVQQQRIFQVFKRPRKSAPRTDRLAVVRAVHTSMRADGYSDVQIAGILGNLDQESNLSPFARNPKSGAFGIMQWVGPRAGQLKAFELDYFSKHPELDPQTFEGQLRVQVAFILHEANGTHSAQYSGLKRMKTLRGATNYFRRKVEVPGRHETHDDKRFRAAREHLSLIESSI